MENVTIGLALIAGFLSFISPCVLPLVPAYIGYLGARLTHDVALQAQAPVGGVVALNNHPSRTLGARFGLFIHGVLFVVGFTLVFVAFGLMTTGIISIAGPARATLTDIIARLGGTLIIFFGLNFMGVIRALFKRLRANSAINSPLFTWVAGLIISVWLLWGFVEPLIALPILAAFWLWMVLGDGFKNPATFWNRLMTSIETVIYSDTRRDMDAKGEGIGGSLLMGVIFAAGWTPCIGPVYGSVLNLAASTGDVGQAMPLLLAYSLGLGIPFILTALLLDQAQGLLRRLQKHMHTVERVMGALLLFIGLLVATGRLQDISVNLTNQFTEVSTRIENCGVGFFQGDIALHQVGPCLNRQIVPLAIGEISIGNQLKNHAGPITFIFHARANTTIYVEIGDLKDITSAELVATLVAPNGEELTRATGDIVINSDTLLVINGLELTQEGIYQLIVSIPASADSQALDFSARIRTSPPRITAQTSLDNIPVVELPNATEDNSALDAILNGQTTDAPASIEALAQASDPIVGTAIGNLAPDFTLQTDGGETVSLSDLRGQVVLLNFWGTWCGPCRREMPEFQRIYEERADEGFTILAVAIRDNVDNVVEFRREFGLSFTLALDSDNAVADLYGIQTAPSTLIISPDGVVVAKHFGMLVESQITELVAKALAEGS